MNRERKIVKLWADNSDVSKSLADKLSDKGYYVKHINTASDMPVTRREGNPGIYACGLEQIKTAYGIDL